MNTTTEPSNSPVAFDFAKAIEHGKRQVIATSHKNVPVFIVPNDMKVETLSTLVDQQLQRPYRLNQTVKAITAESFVEYFNRYATESSTIFVNDENSTFTAVLDYHDSPQEAAWKGHQVTYQCPKTKEWCNWTKGNNERMSQEDFALFIEDNLKEIDEPNGAEMLEIASSLKASNNVDFKSALRLDNGEVQFNYTETINGIAGNAGQMKIPEKITLIIAPFLKGAAYKVEARFRYRIAPSGLVLWYTLIRPHAFVDDAFSDVVVAVQSNMKTGHLVHGTF